MKYLFLDEVDVTPLAGVWIEITKKTQPRFFASVVPLAGTWIEIKLIDQTYHDFISRPPRGDVD